ncbi:MAG: hypothetical protein NT007_01205 [Candidatus Kapabacteria bacterium]|nr:hypothetical protein [Candidatus Kapabacteria bacterium]
MPSKDNQENSELKVINHIQQTPWDNLSDMLLGDFNSTGLTNEENLKICTDCIEVANCPYGFMRIAELLTDISEFSLAEETYKKAELLLNEPSDYMYLAQSITDNFNFSWGMELLETGIRISKQKPNVWGYTVIGNVLAETVGDQLRARKYYQFAETFAVRPSHFEFIADGVDEYLEDKNWSAELLEKSKVIPNILTKN